MRGVFIKSHGGPEVVEVGDLVTPHCGPGQVRVRIQFAALNHLDLWVRGGWPGLKLTFPHVLCSDGAGVVESVGVDVLKVKPGQAVLVHPGVSCGKCDHCTRGTESLCAHYKILGEQLSGTGADFVVVPEVNVFSKSSALSFEQAASAALVFTTAWEMLVVKGCLKAGDWVLIHGAGSGVSSAAIQIASLFGAEIAVTSGSDTKLERAKGLGAHHLINYKTQDFEIEVKKLRKPGADIIVDHVGQAFWEKNIKVLRSGGTLVTCGATTGVQGKTDLAHLYFRQLKLLGSTMGSKRDFPRILGLLETGKLKPVLDKTFSIDETVRAQCYLADADQFGKVLLKVS